VKLELDVNRDLGTLMRAMRLRAGITQESIAKKLGVSRPAIPNMEAGKQNIYLHHLIRTADACGFEVKLKVRKK
jgi:transcriptional regulator with XRE-family HTH domain